MKKVLVISLLLLCFGCSKEQKKAKLEISCDSVISNVEVSEGNTISCELLGETYELKVTKITDNEVKLENNKYGLTDDDSIIKNIKEFSLKDKLRLKTQTTDIEEYLIIERK